jgi:glycosyltransferase involved in cell wall biosynthesis
MKVLLVSQEFPPETRWGGIGTYMGILAPALVRAGCEVHVLSVVRGQARSSTTSDDGVHVHRAPLLSPPGIGKLSGYPLTWLRVALAGNVAREYRRLVRETGSRFDVVECPDWNAEGLVLARRNTVPTVVRVHSSAQQLFPFLGALGPDERRAIRIEDDAIRHADLVLGTRPQIAYARGLGVGDAHLRELTLPVSPATPTPIPAGPPVIAFAGRFEHRKSPETLIRALPAVRAALPDARLQLVGRDCTRPGIASSVVWLRELAADLGVDDAVDVVDGWATSDTVANALRDSTVCAVPSRWESFGYVAAEAAALGRPVVASAVPGFSDIVIEGETGRLVPVDDIDAWARALTSVLADPGQASAMGAAAAHRMATECDPDRIAASTVEAYGDAIASARRGAPIEVVA